MQTERQLIISDIHSNSIALDYLLTIAQIARHMKWHRLRCLGDILGYYDDPVGAWNRVAGNGSNAYDPDFRIGNHDLYLIQWLSGEYEAICKNKSLGDPVVLAVALQAEVLTAQGVAPTLKQLDRQARMRPFEEKIGAYRYLYVHGSPAGSGKTHVETYLPPSYGPREEGAIRAAINAALDYQQVAGERVVVFTGHTHIPMIAWMDQNETIHFDGAKWTTLDEDRPFAFGEIWNAMEGPPVLIVNGGSIGQPRMGHNYSERIHALLLDPGALTLRFLAIPYPADPQSNQALERRMRAMSFIDTVAPDSPIVPLLAHRLGVTASEPDPLAAIETHWQPLREGLINTIRNGSGRPDTVYNIQKDTGFTPRR